VLKKKNVKTVHSFEHSLLCTESKTSIIIKLGTKIAIRINSYENKCKNENSKIVISVQFSNVFF